MRNADWIVKWTRSTPARSTMPSDSLGRDSGVHGRTGRLRQLPGDPVPAPQYERVPRHGRPPENAAMAPAAVDMGRLDGDGSNRLPRRRSETGTPRRRPASAKVTGQGPTRRSRRPPTCRSRAVRRSQHEAHSGRSSESQCRHGCSYDWATPGRPPTAHVTVIGDSRGRHPAVREPLSTTGAGGQGSRRADRAPPRESVSHASYRCRASPFSGATAQSDPCRPTEASGLMEELHQEASDPADRKLRSTAMPRLGRRSRRPNPGATRRR